MRIKAKINILFLFLFLGFQGITQNKQIGVLIGNVVDEQKNGIEQATIQLKSYKDSSLSFSAISDKNGFFSFSKIDFGYYQLIISHVNFNNLKIDSIHFRSERFDFSLNDLALKPKSNQNLNEIIIYAEKPLIESKEGNIVFNAAESALASGSNASELLNNVPLVTKDPNGKILLRGKEPKILIDSKPVELNLQQLQDMLESLPGSSIEKIEIMTNPPPEYANEQGGVINIVTRKGKLGIGGRVSVSAGSRGEATLNSNFNYRKNKIAFNVNVGTGFNRFEGNGNSVRRILLYDSSNFFNTKNNYQNENNRPSLRINMDYEIAKNQTLNFVFQYNQNNFDNHNFTTYTQLNLLTGIYGLSERSILSFGKNSNSNLNFTYTLRGKKHNDQLRIISGVNFSVNKNDRNFYQQYFNPNYTPNGLDSSQNQFIENQNVGYNLRISYDKTLANKKTNISLGNNYHFSNNDVDVNVEYKKKPENVFIYHPLLSNQFQFSQKQIGFRASVKQRLAENLSLLLGMNVEVTSILFDLIKENSRKENAYWNFLPFANFNKSWNDKLNLTFSYRRTIRRPGIQELNPTIDFADPYNLRFGNYQLKPSLAHNFDLVIGKTKPLYFVNFGVGFNSVENIFSHVRTLLPDGRTQITWENISTRKEFELSTWNGISITPALKVNMSASYTYNAYSVFDKTVRKFRNGASLTSNLNGNYSKKDIWNLTANFTLNRFANPQGSVNWNLSMNTGIQRKILDKRLILTLNFLDPFRNQKIENFTYGKHFELNSFQTTKTSNYRLTVAYNFIKKQRNPLSKIKK